MIKKVEPTGDVCIKFTDEEMSKLGIKEGDKFTFEEKENGSILLQKFANMEIDISEWSRDVLEKLISDSCERDISVNEVISDILESYIENLDKDVVDYDRGTT
jgi:bifunctional DNA-binding transcriptional regulator/antitoxin component of YhaV-PrlF toxin-antitoxin module